MGFIDIVLGGLLVFAAYKGIRNGLFVELASLVSFYIGIFIAVKFSSVVGEAIGNGSRIVAFILTFALVVIGVYFLAKVLSKVAKNLFLGWANTLGGAVFAVLKATLFLGTILYFIQTVNINNLLISKETQEKSWFFNPVLKTSRFCMPLLTDSLTKVKKEVL